MGALKIFHNGKIATNSKPYFVEAVAIEDGKIASVGRSSEILRLKTPDTTIVDLKGHTVIPGLNDWQADSSRRSHGSTKRTHLRSTTRKSVTRDCLCYLLPGTTTALKRSWQKEGEAVIEETPCSTMLCSRFSRVAFTPPNGCGSKLLRILRRLQTTTSGLVSRRWRTLK